MVIVLIKWMIKPEEDAIKAFLHHWKTEALVQDRRGLVGELWRIVAMALLPISAMAFELDPICHQYYDLFKMSDLTYEDVGKIADKMHEKNCWPALQGLTNQETQMPVALDCNTLADDIAQQSPDIVRIYSIEPLSAKFCAQSLRMFKDSDGELGYFPTSTEPMDIGLYSACGPLMGASTARLENLTRQASRQPSARGRPDRVLNCTGTSYGDDALIYFYLDRFPDGEEYWGVIPLP